jgi:tetratricopeptide (TPR) repeat protein
MDLLGLSGSTLDGRSLFSDPPDSGRAVYVESLAPLFDHGWAPLHALRRAKSKLIRAPEMEYYELGTDISERDNIYVADRPDVVQLEDELGEMLEGWGSPLDSLVAESRLDPEEYARLAALGYVGGQRPPGEIGVADPKTMMPIWNRIKQADGLCNAGRFPEAIREIESVLAEQPASAKAWYTATRIYNRSGRPDLARTAIRTAVRLHPRSDGYVTLAQMALVAGDSEEFESALVRAAQLDPDDGGIYIARGDSLAVRGKYREALPHFEKALAVDPYRSGAVARRKISQIRKIIGS